MCAGWYNAQSRLVLWEAASFHSDDDVSISVAVAADWSVLATVEHPLLLLLLLAGMSCRAW
jgi:hypothetical protein